MFSRARPDNWMCLVLVVVSQDIFGSLDLIEKDG